MLAPVVGVSTQLAGSGERLELMSRWRASAAREGAPFRRPPLRLPLLLILFVFSQNSIFKTIFWLHQLLVS